MSKIVREKNLGSLQEFGNVEGFAEALNTDLENGISDNEDDLCCPRLSEAKAPDHGLVHFLVNACNKYIVVGLLICAVLSIGFGIKEEGLETGWYEGAYMFLAIFILVANPAMYNMWNYRKLSARKREMVVDVVRGRCQQEINISKVLMGDIVCLKAGQHVPGDGLFISGEALKVDDELDTTIDKQNPFLFYGAKVINGNGRMLVTSVGTDTVWGEMMSKVTDTLNKKTPFQVQLDRLNFGIQVTGVLITGVILVVLFLRFSLGKENDDSGFPADPKVKQTVMREFVDAIKRISMKPRGKVNVMTSSLTMLLVGMTEGLPFVVALAITYWNKKTLSCKGTVQDLLACVTMGSVTTICTDKIPGLMNEMEVEMFCIDEECIDDVPKIAPDVLEALHHGICTPALRQQSTCNSTEDALLSWALQKLDMNVEILKQQCTIVDAKDLNSNEDRCGVLMRTSGGGNISMSSHWRGLATTILAMCSHCCDIRGEIKVIDEDKRIAFQRVIKDMRGQNLKTVAYAYKKNDAQMLEEKELVWLGLVGLKCSCRKQIETCINAGVNIILVSGDNMSALETVAVDCGILVPNSEAVVLDGKTFRSSTESERMNMVDRICIMGEALGSDKLLLVKCLREKGRIVAVVGVRTDETPALKEADVGITVGSRSTEMAKESSDIIILDGNNFNFLVTITRYGRCAYENIQKFIQVELSMTIAWFLINPMMTGLFGDASITAIQLLWVYLIVAILSGMALLTKPPIKKVTGWPLLSQLKPLITRTMWRNVAIQALYQTTILVAFQFKGQAIIGINPKVSKTIIFNSFVLCQVFNQFNAREIEKKNVFKGIHRDHWFWLAVSVTVGLQEAFIEIAHVVAGSARLNGKQWAVCFLIGIVSWAMDLAVKCISEVIAWLVNWSTTWFKYWIY